MLLPTNPRSDSPTIPAYYLGGASCPGCTKVLPGNPNAAGPQVPQQVLTSR
jgi:hypothetical protein